jgi:IgGFc binding protein
VAQRGTSTVAQRARVGRPRVAQPRARAAWAAFATFLARAALPVVLGAAAVGCGAGATLGADGGADGGGAPPGCVGTTACQGTSVHACRGGRPADVIEDCASEGLTCSLGRCISPACAKTESDEASASGCLFYTFNLDNVTADQSIPTSVLLTNAGQTTATASLERRVGGVWTSIASTPVAPRLSARLVLPASPAVGGGAATAAAFRVTTDLPVTAAHVQSDDSVAGGSTSSGGTMLLPAHVLGQRYRALTYPQVATPELLATPGARGGAGQIVIIGTADHTSVTVTAPALASFGPAGGTPVVAAGAKLPLMLDDGDEYEIFSIADGDDLTGALVESDKAVAVFSGNISTTYGIAAMGISSPDLAHEQLLPVTSWGLSYVAAALAPQTGVCDPLLDPPGSSIWTLLADRDDTEVHFAPFPGGAQTPPDRTLAAGESFHVVVPQSFTVTASRPFLVMQGMDCEPTLSSALPTLPWLTDTRFAVLPAFDTMIALARPAGTPVYLDDATLADSLFDAVGGGFEVASVPLAPCPRQDVVCTHHVEGKFGLTVRGMDVQCSYALTVPSWVPCADPNAPGCVN